MEPRQGELIDEALKAYDHYWLALRQTAEPVWAQLDLTGSQIKGVTVVHVRGCITIGQVADMLAIGRPSASTLIEQLVQRGLVERSEDPDDRRRTFVTLTSEGKNLATRLHQGDIDYMRIWFEQLDDADLAALRTGLTALSAAIRKSL